MNNDYITVSQLNKYLKYKFENDKNLVNVYLKGEVSNFKAHTRGHLYFTIKDEESRINAVMFASSAKNLVFSPEDGMKVLVNGRISVYETAGAYQIYVEEMTEDGLGNLHIAFEQLKKKLEAEGLFDPKHKKAIPKMPQRIGVITASTGAAIRDILSTLKRRWPITEAILFPCLVQGENAAPDIVRNLELADNYDLDLIILGRGGGSIEDLWAFNEEIVARAIFAAKTPIISAVGHEVDFTISDFVADLRAATPTGAAELAVPSKEDFYNYLRQINIRLNKSTANILDKNKKRLANIKNSYIFANPINIYLSKEQKFDDLYERLKIPIFKIIKDNEKEILNLNNRLKIAITKEVDFNKNIFSKLLASLETLNPASTIKRGYSISRSKTKIIKSIKDVKKGDELNIELSDGKINAIVSEKGN